MAPSARGTSGRLVDRVGEGCGAQTELGFRAGGVDDERFVELVGHLVDLAHGPVDETQRAHLPGRRDLQPRPGAGGLVDERDDVSRRARLGACQVPDAPERVVAFTEADGVSPMSGMNV
jgi:hypothetical protein